MNRATTTASMETEQAPNTALTLDLQNQYPNNVVLPEVLKSIPKSNELPKVRSRWNINEEIASWLTSFHKHSEWLSTTLKTRPPTGSIFLYNRKRVKFRHDGFVWKKRKEGKSTREDHMKLKVKGEECLYGGYVHSAIVPTFHRRSYWLLQNPDIVLVHYLNDWQPHESKGSTDDSLVFNPALDGRHWTTAELLDQIQPMFVGLKLRVNGTTESLAGSASLEALVQYMLAEQAKAGHLTDHKTNEAGSSSACTCQKRRTRRKSSTQKTEAENQQNASLSLSTPVTQPTYTLEPQRPTPPQAKAVPSEIILSCLGQPSVPPYPTLSQTTTSDALVVHMNNSNAAQNSFSPTSVVPTQLNHHPTITPSGNVQYSSVPYTPPRVTTEESEELRKMVDESPHLKTAKNRFQNQKMPENTVRLPNGVLDLMQLNAMSGQPPGQVGQVTILPGTQGQGFVNGSLSVQTTTSGSVSIPSGSAHSGRAPDQRIALLNHNTDSEMSSGMDTTPVHIQASMFNHSHAVGSKVSENLPQRVPTSGMMSSLGVGTVHQTSHTQTMPSKTLPSVSVETPALTAQGHIGPSSETPKSGNPGPSGMQSLPQSKHKMQLDSDAMDSSSSPLEMDFDPYEMLKNTLNLHDLDPETLSQSGIHEMADQGSDIMMDIQNSAHQIFPEKANKDSGHSSVNSSEECLNGRGESSSSLVEIADFSPEWSYPEGGIKVLVAGPWHSPSTEYSCVFDNFAVPASLLQPGVLRCFCPAHEKGLVPLHVMCNGSVISKSVLFEYKARRAAKTQQNSSKQSQQQEWIELNERQFQMALLERLEQIEKRLCHVSSNVTQQQGSSGLCNSHLSFEERVINVCEKLMQIIPSDDALLLTRHQIPRGMSLLHYAAALGYANLIKTLRRWRDIRECLVMELEVDPLNIDNHSCTPLMWACALGHKDAALRLYEWNPKCLRMSDRLHRLPISMARARGHTSLADCLEKMDGQNTTPASSNQISQPIEIPNTLSQLPAFMISSPASQTPDSSVGADFSPIGVENISPSSGVLSQLSVSPHSQGGNSPQSRSSPHMSPLGASDTSEGSIPTSLYDDLQVLLDMDGELEIPDGHREFRGNELFKIPPPPPPPPMSSSGPQCSASTSMPSTSRMSSDDGFSAAGGTMWEELSKKRAENIASSLEKLKKMFAQQNGEDCSEESQESANKEQYLTLAEQILDALPARIKDDETSMNVDDINFGPPPYFPPLSVDIDEEIEDVNDYRSENINSPASTYSTTDSSCMPSPPNLSLDDEGQLDWADFFPDGLIDGTTLGGFSLLTLSDEEQRQLYKAALVIQNAFRQYKGRQQQKQQELEAAVIIQSYYRRYKDYVGYLQMSEAARVIQNRFRSYKNYRQFQESRRAAIIIQSRFRSYRANKQFRKSRDAAILIQQRFRDKRMARLKREQDAARKIQRFIRHYQNRLKS